MIATNARPTAATNSAVFIRIFAPVLGLEVFVVVVAEEVLLSALLDSFLEESFLEESLLEESLLEESVSSCVAEALSVDTSLESVFVVPSLVSSPCSGLPWLVVSSTGCESSCLSGVGLLSTTDFLWPSESLVSSGLEESSTLSFSGLELLLSGFTEESSGLEEVLSSGLEEVLSSGLDELSSGLELDSSSGWELLLSSSGAELSSTVIFLASQTVISEPSTT